MGAVSKRKSGNTKGPLGMETIVGGGHAEPSVLERMKVLSRKERNYLITHRCFLYRNYEKIRRMRGEVENKFGDRLEKIMSSWILRFKDGSNENKPIILPDDDLKLASLAYIAQTLYELYANLIRAKDENGKCLCEPFMELPSKKHFPQFHSVYENGQNTYKVKGLNALEKGILRGGYKSLHALETDIGTVVNSFSQAYEAEKPEIHDIVTKIKKLYKEGKQKAALALDPFIIHHGPQQLGLGNAPPPENSLPRFKTTTRIPGILDVIRCICGTYSEEGMMILCENCLVWQHCDCMRVLYSNPINGFPTARPPTGGDGQYYCEQCQPREVNPEVPMGGPGDTSDKTYYLTLLREDGLLVRKNDTVYVLRDWSADLRISPDGKKRPRKTYKTAGKIVPSECDIFRIQNLFRDANGNGFAFGYNYLRPYETTHYESSRRFYPNELLKGPIVEKVSIDFIHGVCWVVDTPTYCKGRPKGCVEDDLYICDFRVDKAVRAFAKVGKNSQVTCTKPCAFDYFESELEIERNLHPHGPDFKLKTGGSQSNTEKMKGRKTGERAKYKNVLGIQELQQMTKKRSKQRDRLNRVSDTLPGFKT